MYKILLGLALILLSFMAQAEMDPFEQEFYGAPEMATDSERRYFCHTIAAQFVFNEMYSDIDYDFDEQACLQNQEVTVSNQLEEDSTLLMQGELIFRDSDGSTFERTCQLYRVTMSQFTSGDVSIESHQAELNCGELN